MATSESSESKSKTEPKYFKFTQVDAETGHSVISYPSMCPVFPDLPDLKVIWGEGNWYYGTASSKAKENPVNHIYAIKKDEFLDLLSNSLEAYKKDCLSKISQSYKQIKEYIDSQNDVESSTIGAQRYSDAKDFINNSQVSELLTEESQVSGQTMLELSNNIISSYDKYVAKHARLSGLKTLVSDTINSYTISPDNFVDDYYNFYSEREVLGNSIETPNIIAAYSKDPTDIHPEVDNNYTIRKYSSNLHARWELLK